MATFEKEHEELSKEEARVDNLEVGKGGILEDGKGDEE